MKPKTPKHSPKQKVLERHCYAHLHYELGDYEGDIHDQFQIHRPIKTEIIGRGETPQAAWRDAASKLRGRKK